jgi:hypothetical protein
MKLTNTTTQTIRTTTYEIEHPEYGKLTLIDYCDENGKMIDTVLRNAEGEDCSNWAEGVGLLDEVIEFIDEKLS